MALDPKTDLRSYLLTLSAVTALVDSRIRPDQRDESDGELDSIVIEIPNGEQFNDLDGHGGLVQLDVLVRCISHDVTRSEAIAEAVRTNGTDPGSGLDGYTGIAGLGFITQANRDTFSSDAIFDEEGQPTGEHEHAALYAVWFQPII